MCSWHCVLLSWIASVFRFEPWLFHSYDFEIVHDISFLLADGTIMCDAYSTLTMWFWVRFCVLPGSVGVACSPMLPVSCGGIGCEPVSSICHSSSWWGCEYSTFCWQNYAVNFCSKLLYLSYTTDWPGVSVGHPAGALAIFVDGFFWHGWLTLCVTFCPGEFYFPIYPCLLLGSGNSTHVSVWSPTYGIWFCHQEAWLLLLVSVLDHQSFGRSCGVEWWLLCDL